MRAKQLRGRSKCSGGCCRGRGGSHRGRSRSVREGGREEGCPSEAGLGRASEEPALPAAVPPVRAGAARFTRPFERCPGHVLHRGQALPASRPGPVGLNAAPGRVFPALSALRTLSWGVSGPTDTHTMRAERSLPGRSPPGMSELAVLVL